MRVRFTLPMIPSTMLKLGLPLLIFLMISACEESAAPTPITLPDPPTNLRGVALAADEIVLTWQDQADNEEGFIVEQSPHDQLHFIEIMRTGSNLQTVSRSGLTKRTTYFFRVAAYHSQGRSAFTDPVAVTTPDLPPAAPSDLVALITEPGAVRLNWVDQADNEDGFRVERRLPGASGWEVVAQVLADVTTFERSGHRVGSICLYRVRAYNNYGDSDYSNEVQVTFPDLPAAPTNLHATEITDVSISLRWEDQADNEDGFIIQRREPLDFVWQEIQRTLPRTLTYRDHNLSRRMLYSYRVCAFNEVGISDWTPEVECRTKGLPGAPEHFAAEIMSSWEIRLSWEDRSDDETGFELQTSVGDTLDFRTMALLPAGETSFQTNDSILFVDYFYRLRAVNDYGPSFWTEVRSANTPEVIILAGGLEILDVSNPAQPVPIGALNPPLPAQRLHVREQDAYLACGAEGLHIIDLSDLYHPVVRGTFPVTNFASDVHTWEIYALLVGIGNRFQILNVLNPARPVPLASTGTSANCVWAVNGVAWLGTTDRKLRMADISSPDEPQLLEFLPLSGEIEDLIIVDGYGYGLGRRAGFKIFDLRQPSEPLEVSNLELTGHSLSVSGTVACLVTSHSLAIIDLARNSTPRLVGSCPLPGTPWDVCQWGHYAYVADFEGGLMVVDYSDPAAPVLVGTLALPEVTRCVAVRVYE